MRSATEVIPPGRSTAVLTKAVVNAANELGLSKVALADVLGVSESTVARLHSGSYRLQESRKYEWEFALLFVRLYRSLVAIVGPGEPARQWLRGHNTALEARPMDLLRTAEGMIRVLTYLDAYRGRI